MYMVEVAKLNKLSQSSAPIYEALKKYRELRIVSFDVPGHKQGSGNPMLKEFLGADCISVDVNSMKLLATLCHPSSVIRNAEILAAEAFGADRQVSVSREISKLYNETVRGTLEEVIAHFKEKEPKGEFVIVLAGSEK